MKSFLKFLAVFGGVLLLSVLLTPLLFKVLPFKFEKIFNRCVMIFSLVAVAVFVRFDLKKITEYGLGLFPGWRKHIAFGFVWGVGTLVLLAGAKFIFGMGYWDLSNLTVFRWGYKILSVFFTALLIGVIEEFFFRGAVYQTLLKVFKGRIFWAIVITSLFYSIVHFVTVKKPFIGPDPGVQDSLKLLAAPFMSFTRWPDFWRGVVGLFIFGVILNQLAIRTKSLFIPIGLHAGCVFFLKLQGLFVEFSNDQPLLWGSAKMYDSLTGWIALALMGWGMQVFLPRMMNSGQNNNKTVKVI